MFTVPNGKVLVIGGSLKKEIGVTMENIELRYSRYPNGSKIHVHIDVNGTNGAHFDGELGLDIPPHMLTCQVDFLPIFMEMAKGTEAANAIIEFALQKCLRVIRFDLTRKGKIIVDIGLNIRGNLRCEAEYEESSLDFYEMMFDFKK